MPSLTDGAERILGSAVSVATMQGLQKISKSGAGIDIERPIMVAGDASSMQGLHHR